MGSVWGGAGPLGLDGAYSHAPGPPESDYERVLRAHARHYTSLLKQHAVYFDGDPEQQGRRQLAAYHILRLEIGNLLGALETATQRHERDWLMPLARHLWLPLEIECEFRLMLECGELLLAQADAATDDDYRGRCLLFMAQAWRNLGRNDETLACVKEILNAEAKPPAVDLLGSASFVEGLVLFRVGRNVEAITSFQRAIATWETLGNHANAADAVVRQGLARHALGQHDGVCQEVEQAAEQLRQRGDVRREAAALLNLAYLLIRMRRVTEAEVALQKGLDLRRWLQDRRGIANSLTNLVCCQMERRDYVEARKTSIEVLQMLQDLGMTYEEAAAQINLAMIDYAEMDFAAASSHLQAALQSYRRVLNKSGEGMTFRILGMVSLAQGRLDEAATRLKQAYVFAAELNNIREEALCAALTGALLVKRGEYSAGNQLLQAAIELEHEKQLGFEEDIQEIIGSALSRIDEAQAALRSTVAPDRLEAFPEIQPAPDWHSTLGAALHRA